MPNRIVYYHKHQLDEALGPALNAIVEAVRSVAGDVKRVADIVESGGIGGGKTDKKLNEKLNVLMKGMEKLMALSQKEMALLAQIDKVTTAISEAQVELASDIQALIDNPNTSAEEFRAALEPKIATLEGQAEFLKKLAADTNAPVPEMPKPPEA